MKVIQRLNIRLRNIGEIGIALFFNSQNSNVILSAFIYKYRFSALIKSTAAESSESTITATQEESQRQNSDSHSIKVEMQMEMR